MCCSAYLFACYGNPYHYDLPANGLSSSPEQVKVTYEGQGNNNTGLDLFVYNVVIDSWVIWSMVGMGTTDFSRSVTFDSTTIPSISELVDLDGVIRFCTITQSTTAVGLGRPRPVQIHSDVHRLCVVEMSGDLPCP